MNDHPDTIDIVQRLARIEANIDNLCTNLRDWQTRHQAEDTTVHAEVEKQDKRLTVLEAFRTNVSYAATAAGVGLSALGTLAAAKAEALLPLLFGK